MSYVERDIVIFNNEKAYKKGFQNGVANLQRKCDGSF